MKTSIKILISIIVLLQYFPSQAQFQQGWDAIYRGITEHNDNECMDIAIDNSGYVYVTGMCDNPPLPNPYCEYPSLAGTNICTKKYDSSGDTVWTNRIFGCGSDDVGGNAIAVVSTEEGTFVYVAGKTYVEGNGRDLVTIQYNANNGGIIWSETYGGSGLDEAVDIEVDADGNAYVTGYYTNGSYPDYVTIKYNSSGVQQWVATYGSANTNEVAKSLKVDNGGNVYVTGGTSNGITTIKYNSSGIQQWVAYYGSGTGNDIAVDNYYGVYVTGKSGAYFTTIKYDNSDGSEIWVRGPNTQTLGEGKSIRLFKKPCVGNSYCYNIEAFVTGHTTISRVDCGLTIGYDEDGDLLSQWWPQTYTSAAEFTTLAIDPSENIFVFGAADNSDYLTVEYNSSGSNHWSQSYSSYGSSYAEGIVSDGNGNVYVAGYDYYDRNIPVASQYVIIQYVSTGNDGPNNVQNLNGNVNTNGVIPKEYFLEQNYPNPFNPVTLIKYGIPEAGLVKITVYDVLGQEVSQLVNEFEEAGYYDVRFHGSNLPSGIYVYRIVCGDFNDSKKMVIIK